MSLPTLFKPQARYARAWSGHVAVLSPGPLPTVDFYLTPRLRELPASAVHRINSLSDPVCAALPEGTFLVIVRHASTGCLRELDRCRDLWSGVAYLMDDDIPGAWSCAELPLSYRLWTTGRYARVQALLAQVCDRIWFSNDRLRTRYPDGRGEVLPPLEPSRLGPATPAGTRSWAYLGSRVHRREVAWLLPVVEAVQRRSDAYTFEVFGDESVKQLFAHVPRAVVRPPLAWPDFLAYCASARLAVGVAPLLPGRFNAGRTHVKLFDITRCGAAAVLTQVEPYAPLLDGVAAALLPNDPARWVETVSSLLDDDDRRIGCHAKAAAWIEQMRAAGSALPCMTAMVI